MNSTEPAKLLIPPTELKPCPFCGKPSSETPSIPPKVFCHNLDCAIGFHPIKFDKWNTRADAWIPVGERLPENYKEVLVFNKIGQGETWTAQYDLRALRWYSTGHYPADILDFITHWRELPKPPEMKGGG